MKVLENMRIRVKLLCSFAVLLIMVLAMSIFAIYTINQLDIVYSYALDNPEVRLDQVNTVYIRVKDLGRINNLISTYATTGDTATINGLAQDATAVYNDAVSYMKAYNDSIKNDVKLSDADKTTRTGIMNDAQTTLTTYKTQIVDEVTRYALLQDHDMTLEIINNGMSIRDDLQSILDDLLETAINASNTESVGASKTAATAITTTIIIVAVVIGLSMIMAFAIANLISKPIQKLVEVADNVARGNLNVNINTDRIDETGQLAKSFSAVVQNVNMIISDIGGMYKHHEAGEMSNRINDTQYQGAYKEVAAGVNDMVASYVAMLNDIFAVLTDYAGGDFNTRLQQYKGEKAVANQQMNIFRDTIQNIVNEINTVAKAGTDGKLSTRADSDRYKGDWKNIMLGLNNVLDAVIAPINEVQAVLLEMSKGNFDSSVKGDYRGDFAQIKNAMNTTVTAIAGYIKEITDVLGKIAEGDLRVTIKRDYIGQFSYIKESINSISGTLNKTMSEILSASDQVLSGAKQISSSAMSLAEGASEQASAIQELTASVETINQQTQQNAENATTANDLSDKSTMNAKNGNTEMQQMLQAMDGIKDSSNGISKIIKVISDIAFQTNLLALNASVEAARAGEHGRGFSVVADEVRALATKSQASADDTATLIDDSNTRVTDGMRIAQGTAESLNVIVDNAAQISGIIKTIAEASKNQAEAVSQVSIGLSQISQVVQNNSSTSEESAAAAQQLNSQAELLQQMVSFFKI